MAEVVWKDTADLVWFDSRLAVSQILAYALLGDTYSVLEIGETYSVAELGDTYSTGDE